MNNFYNIDFTKCKLTDKIWNEFVFKLNQHNKDYDKFSIQVKEFGVLKVKLNQTNINNDDVLLLFDLFTTVYDKYQVETIDIYKKTELKNNKILPLDDAPSSTTYLFYSSVLAIIQSRANLNNWLLRHYMNIKFYCNMNSPGNTPGLNFLFFDEYIPYDDIMTIKQLAYDDLKDISSIIDFVQENLDKDTYVNVHLDEYYLPAKDNYKKIHFVHENLIYGYDNAESCFLAFGFSHDQTVKTFKITYEDFITAYEKGKIYYIFGAPYLEDNPFAIDLRSFKDYSETAPFTIPIFLQKLKEYLFPRSNKNNENGETVHFGVNAYDLVYQFLEANDLEFNPIDFRVFHLIYEHKLALKHRIQYILDHYITPPALYTLAKKYDELIEKFLSLRNRFLKQVLKEGALFDPSVSIKDIELAHCFSNTLKQLVNKENEILKNIIFALEE